MQFSNVTINIKETGVNLGRCSLSRSVTILLFQLQTVMHRKRAIYSSNSSVFSYRTSGHNKGILLMHETSCHDP